MITLKTKKITKFLIDRKLLETFFDEFNQEYFQETETDLLLDSDGHFLELVEAVEWLVDNNLTLVEWEDFLSDLSLTLVWNLVCLLE